MIERGTVAMVPRTHRYNDMQQHCSHHTMVWGQKLGLYTNCNAFYTHIALSYSRIVSIVKDSKCTQSKCSVETQRTLVYIHDGRI